MFRKVQKKRLLLFLQIIWLHCRTRFFSWEPRATRSHTRTSTYIRTYIHTYISTVHYTFSLQYRRSYLLNNFLIVNFAINTKFLIKEKKIQSLKIDFCCSKNRKGSNVKEEWDQYEHFVPSHENVSLSEMSLLQK